MIELSSIIQLWCDLEESTLREIVLMVILSLHLAFLFIQFRSSCLSLVRGQNSSFYKVLLHYCKKQS